MFIKAIVTTDPELIKIDTEVLDTDVVLVVYGPVPVAFTVGCPKTVVIPREVIGIVAVPAPEVLPVNIPHLTLVCWTPFRYQVTPAGPVAPVLPVAPVVPCEPVAPEGIPKFIVYGFDPVMENVGETPEANGVTVPASKVGAGPVGP